jgi:integrase
MAGERRQTMAGSIRLRRRPDVWELRVFLGRDDDGRVRHRSTTFRGSRRAAERELARLITLQDSEPEPIRDEPSTWGPHNTTVNDAIEAWKQNGWEDLSPKTVRGHEEIWRRYIRDTIGRKRIAALNPYEVEKYFRSLKVAGAGRDTVRRVKSVLHRACRLAARWSGGVLSNPVADTELPAWSLHERRDPVRAPTVEEVRRLLEAASAWDRRFAVFVRVIAASGMRRAEACALRWSDLDQRRSTVRVDEGIVAASGGAVIKGPKTRASIRTLALDAETFLELNSLRVEQLELAEACGLELGSDAFVFSTEPGGMLPPHPEAMTHAFAKLRGKAKVAADIHLHSLRHFHATVLDPVISEAQKQARLGWSTVAMARHYTDAVPEEDRRAAEHVSKLLRGETSGRSAAESA